MTTDMFIVLSILLLAIILFVTERVRVDLVALLVLVCLALSGLVSVGEALSGFSNVAVVTVWAVLILSGGMARTGVADVLGQRILRTAGSGEVRLIVITMLVAGILSGFMNSIGVAALMLPVVLDIARRTGIAPSKLLMPLAFASLMGGLNTLIGTPPNILISEALRDQGMQPFRMFDFTPVGAVVTLSGVAFMVLVGRRLLPNRDIARDLANANGNGLAKTYDLEERLFALTLPPDSPLSGMTVAESRLGSALGVNLVGIWRSTGTELAPGAEAMLRAGDRLLVTGRQQRMQDLRGRQQLLLDTEAIDAGRLASAEVELAQIGLSADATYVGQTLDDIRFRGQFGVNVLAILRDGRAYRTNLRDMVLRNNDILLVQGPHERIYRFGEDAGVNVSGVGDTELHALGERLFTVRIPAGSTLVGRSILDSQLADAFGLTVLGIERGDETMLMPSPEQELSAEDLLIVEGRSTALKALQGLQDLDIEALGNVGLGDLETDQVGLSEVVLSPHTALAGKSLRQIRFREKYGLSVVAIWREGRAYRSSLANMRLKFGDALLLYGQRGNLHVLATDPDFLVLTEGLQEPARKEKAPIAALIMVAVLLPVILGWLSIAISAIAGVVLMILTGCLNMDEAYQAIEWKAIFLIAGMLPLGIALERTGAASLVAQGVVSLTGGLGPVGVLAGLFIMAALVAQVMPNPAVAVLLAPIALSVGESMGVSPYPLLMAVAVSSSAAFMSPVGHPANVLIMGPGGYRLSDYVKVGAPLTLIVLGVVLITVPLVWPF